MVKKSSQNTLEIIKDRTITKGDKRIQKLYFSDDTVVGIDADTGEVLSDISDEKIAIISDFNANFNIEHQDDEKSLKTKDGDGFGFISLLGLFGCIAIIVAIVNRKNEAIEGKTSQNYSLTVIKNYMFGVLFALIVSVIIPATMGIMVSLTIGDSSGALGWLRAGILSSIPLIVVIIVYSNYKNKLKNKNYAKETREQRKKENEEYQKRIQEEEIQKQDDEEKARKKLVSENGHWQEVSFIYELLKKTPVFRKWRIKQWECQRGKCAWCEKPIQMSTHNYVDHIVSRHGGGTNNSKNLVLTCYKCNKYKSNKAGYTRPIWIKDNPYDDYIDAKTAELEIQHSEQQ